MNESQKKLSPDIFWVFLCIGIAALILGKLWISYQSEVETYGEADFAVFYTVAEYLADDGEIYSNEDLFNSVVKNRGSSGAVRYLYPPTAMLFLSPVAWLPYSTSVVVWFCLGWIFLLLVVYLLFRILNIKFTGKPVAIVLAASLVFDPLYTNLRVGQVNMLLTLLLILHIWLALKNKWKLAGVVLGGMVVIKLFPLALIIYYALKNKWNVVFYSVISVFILLVISVGIFGVSPHVQYIDKAVIRVTEGIHINGLSRHNNVTLNGFIHRFFLLNENTNPFIQANRADSTIALQKLRTRIEKTEIFLSADALARGNWIHLAIVVPLLFGLMYLTWRTGKSGSTFIEVYLWLSMIFLAAKDAHIQYLIMLLPLWLYLFFKPPQYLKKHPVTISLLAVSFILMSLSEAILLPTIQLPDWLYVLPIGLLGNSLLLFTLGTVYFKDTMKRGQNKFIH